MSVQLSVDFCTGLGSIDRLVVYLQVLKCIAICIDRLMAYVQVLGKCPTVSIDKTDGCQVFLSKDSLKCEIISAKSSEMNICVPPPPGKQDFVSTWWSGMW